MKILKSFLISSITILLAITTQNFVKIGEKNFFGCTVVQKWSKNVRKILISDFDEILCGNSHKYGDSNHQKNFLNFCFSDHFLTVWANAQLADRNFCCKIFCLQKKSTGANLKHIHMCVQKVVFSSKHENGGVAVLPPGGRDPQN